MTNGTGIDLHPFALLKEQVEKIVAGLYTKFWTVYRNSMFIL